ncbi:MAG TPA: hypothetical protein VMW75_17790 [Thermoanaerobaculia bacterium]|nr:hypothetical protein [Thermoanaerobaculia bacterium]
MTKTGPTGGTGDKPLRQALKVADTAVEKLGIKAFIKDHLKDITGRLEECENAAQNAPVDSNMLFVALALPILNGVIRIASNRTKLQDAMRWATHEWRGDGQADPGDFDAIAILSSLTLIYVVGEIRKLHKDSPVWESIVDHIRELGRELAS